VPIIRGHHNFDDHYTQMPNAWLRDARLSFRARGLISLIMSHSQGWSLSINSLADQNQEGKDALRSAILELEALGYLSRSQPNEGGRFGESIWTTHDPEDSPLTEKPLTVNPTPKKTITKEDQVKNTIAQQVKTDEKPTKPKPHAIPSDFEPSSESIKTMAEHFPWVDLKLETHAFKAHWQSTGRNANKTNWSLTWENWIRNSAKWSKGKQEAPVKKHKFTGGN